MITGDENLVDIDFVVFWRIADAAKYLFAMRDPDLTVKVAAEAVMRDIIGGTRIQDALTDRRGPIKDEAQVQLQRLRTERRRCGKEGGGTWGTRGRRSEK